MKDGEACALECRRQNTVRGGRGVQVGEERTEQSGGQLVLILVVVLAAESPVLGWRRERLSKR